jgi:hypothetical protein
MERVYTKWGNAREDRLVKRVDVVDTETHRIVATEYCPIECHGLSHKLGEAFTDGCFCPFHVRRDVDVTVKEFPEGESVGFTATLP